MDQPAVTLSYGIYHILVCSKVYLSPRLTPNPFSTLDAIAAVNKSSRVRPNNSLHIREGCMEYGDAYSSERDIL